MKVVRPYRKKIKGDIYRWVVQLPSGVEPPDTLYVISTKPLVIAATPELPRAKIECPKDVVELLRRKIAEKSFRKAVGSAVVEAIARLLEVCD